MSDHAPKRYKMVRITEQTHARLSRFRDHLHRLYQECKLELPDDQADHLTLDWVINELMDRTQRHRLRARRQREANRQLPPK